MEPMAGTGWENSADQRKLRFMAAIPPGAPPTGVNLDPDGDPQEFLAAFRAYAVDHVDPELLCGRKEVWDNEPAPHGLYPSWLTLRPDPFMNHWRPVIKGPLGCDDRACQMFVRLLETGAPSHGYMEGCRILAHLMKDKKKKENTFEDLHDKGMGKGKGKKYDPDNWSGFLKKASEEAIEALEDPDDVRNLRRPYHEGAWEQYVPLAPGKGSSSSSSGAGPKGTGKSYVYQQGYRG